MNQQAFYRQNWNIEVLRCIVIWTFKRVHQLHSQAPKSFFTFKAGVYWPYKCHYWARRPVCAVSQMPSLDLDAVSWSPPPICTLRSKKRFCFWRCSFEGLHLWCPFQLLRFRLVVGGTWSLRRCRWGLTQGFPTVLWKSSVLCLGDQGRLVSRLRRGGYHLKPTGCSGSMTDAASLPLHCLSRCSSQRSWCFPALIGRMRPNLSGAEKSSVCAAEYWGWSSYILCGRLEW